MKKDGLPGSLQTRQMIRGKISGYKVLNELGKKEDRENLPGLTAEASAQIYAGLWEMWEQTRKQHQDYKNLDRKRIHDLVERRKLLDKIGGA